MEQDLGYGRRISGEEYDRRIVSIHSGLSPMPSTEEELAVRRAELDCAVDHRLGCDYPRDKREALWRILQDVEKRRVRLAARHLVTSLFRSRSARERGPTRGADALTRAMVERFSEVLDATELESFFELGGDPPSLPKIHD